MRTSRESAQPTATVSAGQNITLAGNCMYVDLEGQRVTRFDPDSPEVPRKRQWFEPKREPKRPEVGYLGLQNHDPGDIVWFKEISVRPLPIEEVK